MKITIQQYSKTYSIDFGHDDVPMEELYPELKQLVLACGYHPDTVNEYFQET